eukprot:354232-Chlamydomonas_euryale.AAC.3
MSLATTAAMESLVSSGVARPHSTTPEHSRRVPRKARPCQPAPQLHESDARRLRAAYVRSPRGAIDEGGAFSPHLRATSRMTPNVLSTT